MKVVVVTGLECTGSKLCAKIVAHVLNICEYGTWNGMKWTSSNNKAVLHRSTPAAVNKSKKQMIDPQELIKTYKDLSFVFTTRDSNIIAKRKKYSLKEKKKWINANREIIKTVVEKGIPYMYFSYEAFMTYKDIYIKELYKFLDVQSNFLPSLRDGNIKYLKHNEI